MVDISAELARSSLSPPLEAPPTAAEPSTAVEAASPPRALALGTPLNPSIRALVLDPDTLELLPKGQAGTLFLAGPNLFQAYIGMDDAATREVLSEVPSHLKAYVPLPTPAVLFNTHDRVHVDTHGSFFYLGREDSIVKIHGHRVDLVEVEQMLKDADVEGVGIERTAAAALLGRDANDEPQLVGFVMPAAVDTRALVRGLAPLLPQYMVPRVIFALNDFPVTASGKIDRAGLVKCRVVNSHTCLMVMPR